jgi:hypothetical protein
LVRQIINEEISSNKKTKEWSQRNIGRQSQVL